MSDRFGPERRLLQTVHLLQHHRYGVTIDDLIGELGVGKRTVQRLLRAVESTFPELERQSGDDRRVRFRLPVRVLTPGDVTADELADLKTAAAFLRANNQTARARSLESLLGKVEAALKQRLSMLSPDMEALCEAEGIAMRPGPRPLIRDDVLSALREAIKMGVEIYVRYRRARSRSTTGRTLRPYGMLFGKQPYLVASYPDKRPEPHLYRLANIESVRILGEQMFSRPADFDLRQFARGSFGVFQDRPHDVVWRFAPKVADEAAQYMFHPTQSLEPQEDGALLVRFRAGGLLEMCWHLYTWGSDVEVLEPKELREMLPKAWKHSGFAVAD